MLPVKPWKTDAVVRLLVAVFVCIYSGSLLTSVAAHIQSGRVDWKVLAVAAAAFVLLGETLMLLRKPWELETIMRDLGMMVLAFYGGLFLGAWAQHMARPPGPSVAQMVISALTFQGAALILVGLFMREHGTSWDDAFGLDHKTLEAVLYGVTVACVFLPVGWGLQWASGEVMKHVPQWRAGPEEQQAVQTLRMASGWLDRAVLGLVTIAVAPFAEEMLFRGILYPWIKRIGYPRLALWGTSLLFAAIHLNVATFIPLLTLSLCLTVLYERTTNLCAPIAAHALFNGMNFTTLYLLERQFR